MAVVQEQDMLIRLRDGVIPEMLVLTVITVSEEAVEVVAVVLKDRSQVQVKEYKETERHIQVEP
jgi:hypothetical protein